MQAYPAPHRSPEGTPRWKPAPPERTGSRTAPRRSDRIQAPPPASESLGEASHWAVPSGSDESEA